MPLPDQSPDLDTFLKLFKRNVSERPNDAFLGTRQRLADGADGKPQFGEYQWKTWSEVDQEAQKLARGFINLNLCPQVEGDGQLWRFIGVWSKNRWEWTETLLAAMHYKITTVGFYDAMSAEQVDFILNQTEMQTVVCSKDYALKLIEMKRSGEKAGLLRNLVVIDDISQDNNLVQAAGEV